MNKPIDDLFEQARASLQADMPLENVETLIQRSTGSTSIWTWKTIISSMSIIGIIIAITLGSLLMTSADTPIAEANSLPLYSTLILKESSLVEPTVSPLKITDQTLYFASSDSMPPMPVAPPSRPPVAVPAPPAPPIPPVPPALDRSSFLDSLGPKKTFTEYTLEIRKDNSERELKALQQELERYGITLQILQLKYNSDQTIKRFKGRFETDSLFCSTEMSEHEFDIQGAFKSMQFTFRVADEKNLKYLKIQSDDFEQTIECYDDEVLIDRVKAEAAAKIAQRAMYSAERQMQQAQREAEAAQRLLQLTHQEAARSRANILRLKADNLSFMTEQQFLKNFPHTGNNVRVFQGQDLDSVPINIEFPIDIKNIRFFTEEQFLDSFPRKEWFEKGNFSLDSMPSVGFRFKDLELQLESLERLVDEDWINVDSFFLKNKLKDYSNELRFQLDNTRLDLEKLLQDRSKTQRLLEREVEIDVQQLLEEHQLLKMDEESLEKQAKQLQEEAKRLQQRAKEMKKEAKKRAKAKR